MPPLVSIQNPGSEKLQEGVSRAPTVLVLGKKNRVLDMGEKWSVKNRVQRGLRLVQVPVPLYFGRKF